LDLKAHLGLDLVQAVGVDADVAAAAEEEEEEGVVAEVSLAYCLDST
jgi:hypothetical protein